MRKTLAVLVICLFSGLPLLAATAAEHAAAGRAALDREGKRAEAKSSYGKALQLAPGDKDVTAALKRVS